jgi:hypothetical protein
MKHVHRLIVTSAAYRMQSTFDEQNAARDRDNRFLWQFRSRRIEAEVVRDSLLYVSGQLDLKRYRRKESIVPQQALALANSELALVQARLVARRLSAGAACSGVPSTEYSVLGSAAFITAAFEQVLTRSPTADELAACESFLDEQVKLFQMNQSRLVGATTDPADGSKPSADLALRARENLVHVLLNHHEFVTMR